MPTRAEVEELWRAWKTAQNELNNSESFQRMEDLRRHYNRAYAEMGAQERVEETQARADRKAAFKVELAAAKDKRPLRELVADPTVVETFDGWRFGTKTGMEIELFGKATKPFLAGFATWDELRYYIGTQGRWPQIWFGKKWVEGFKAIRKSDQSWRGFPVDNVVAWKVG